MSNPFGPVEFFLILSCGTLLFGAIGWYARQTAEVRRYDRERKSIKNRRF